MAKVQISGHSDDIISIAGAVSDEFSGDEEPRFVVLYPTRDVFLVRYGDPLNPARGVDAYLELAGVDVVLDSPERASEGDDPEPYTDTAHASSFGDSPQQACQLRRWRTSFTSRSPPRGPSERARHGSTSRW